MEEMSFLVVVRLLINEPAFLRLCTSEVCAHLSRFINLLASLDESPITLRNTESGYLVDSSSNLGAMTCEWGGWLVN